MTSFKKATCAVLAFVFIFALTACGGSEDVSGCVSDGTESADSGDVSDDFSDVVADSVSGVWKNENTGLVIEFKDGGELKVYWFNFVASGIYSVKGDLVTVSVNAPIMDIEGGSIFRIEDNKLCMSAPDSTDETYLTRVAEKTETASGTSIEHPAPGVADLSANCYKNESFGFELKFDSTWGFTMKEDFASDLGTMDYAEALQSLDLIYDLYAVNMLDGSQIIILYDNMKNHWAVAYEVDPYLRIIKTDIEITIDSQGGKVKTAEPVTRTLNGEEYCGYFYTIDYGGSIIYQYLFAMKFGDYMGCISVYSTSVEELDLLLGMFNGIEEL